MGYYVLTLKEKMGCGGVRVRMVVQMVVHSIEHGLVSRDI